ncbi:MAG: TetR/AcrR family transcriptional regulator [Bacillota bacterium]
MATGLRKAKRNRVRRALFEAAIALFQDHGFEAVSVEEIAERAGYSRATFFNHFQTKEGVLRHYGEHLREQVEAGLLLLGAETGPLERIRSVLQTMMTEAELHREEARIVYLYSSGDPSHLANPTLALELLTTFVREAQEAGLARRDLPAEETGFLVAGMLQVATLAVVLGGRTAESMVDVTWQFILGGVRGEGKMAP